jgi:hypothetical protein
VTILNPISHTERWGFVFLLISIRYHNIGNGPCNGKITKGTTKLFKEMKNNNSNQQKWSSHFLNHLDKWKYFYNLLGHLILLIAVVIAFISLLLSLGAIKQTKRSIDLTQDAVNISKDALQIQKDEFYIRNRPFILIRDTKFSGPVTTALGHHADHSVFFSMTNGSPIPANSIIIEGKIFINDQEIRKTIFGPESLSSDIGLAALPPDTHTSINIPLTNKEYERAKNQQNKFLVTVEIKYSGILGSPEDKYFTSYTVLFNSKENKFSMVKSKYE